MGRTAWTPMGVRRDAAGRRRLRHLRTVAPYTSDAHASAVHPDRPEVAGAPATTAPGEEAASRRRVRRRRARASDHAELAAALLTARARIAHDDADALPAWERLVIEDEEEPR